MVLFQKLASPSSWAQLDTYRVDQAHIWACTPGYAQMGCHVANTGHFCCQQGGLFCHGGHTHLWGSP